MGILDRSGRRNRSLPPTPCQRVTNTPPTASALNRQHDTLVGISAALSSGDFGGEIVMVTTPLVVPNFNLPALSDGSDYLATSGHRAHRAGHAFKMVCSAQPAERKPEAEIDDLIGPAVVA